MESAIAFGALGRALAPVPFAATTFAIEAILRLGDDEQRKNLLPGLLSGERIAAFAITGYEVADAGAATVRRQRRDGRTTLTGECTPS